MKHFKKHKNLNYRFLISGFTEWRLYPYTPRNNEFERGLKYRLCESWYSWEWGEERIIERYKVSSINEAENIIRGLRL